MGQIREVWVGAAKKLLAVLGPSFPSYAAEPTVQLCKAGRCPRNVDKVFAKVAHVGWTRVQEVCCRGKRAVKAVRNDELEMILHRDAKSDIRFMGPGTCRT